MTRVRRETSYCDDGKNRRKKEPLTLSGRIGRNVIGAGCGADDSVGRPRGVGQQNFAEGREGALELTRQRRQIIDHQRQLAAE